jgi:hypothetical protein
MMTVVQPYIDLILRERSWSWAVVCLLYILAAIFVRSWFIGPVTVQLRSIDKKHVRQFKSAYLKGAFLGWVLFFIPLILIATYWNKAMLPIQLQESWLIGIGFASFILSVMLHLQALASAAISEIGTVEGEKIAEV